MKKKLLIVIDMQNDFISGSLGSPMAQAIVPNVVEKIEKYVADGCEVFFTRDTHGADYLETQEGRNLPVVHCVEGTWGHDIESSVAQVTVNHMLVYGKSIFVSEDLLKAVVQYNRTGFGLYEEFSGLDEIELIGLCSDICVVSNALVLKAILPEIKITVDASCCAGVTVESHNAALLTMKMCQVNVINWEV